VVLFLFLVQTTSRVSHRTARIPRQRIGSAPSAPPQSKAVLVEVEVKFLDRPSVFLGESPIGGARPQSRAGVGRGVAVVVRESRSERRRSGSRRPQKIYGQVHTIHKKAN
jgi:hypothetical protein